MANAAVSRLIALQTPDGGFGPYPGAESRTEATALAGLALLRSLEPEAVEPARAAVEWLAGTQTASGAWPLSRSVEIESWSSSLAVLALTHGRGDDAAIERGARWLLSEEGQGSPWWVKLLFRLFPDRKTVELDADLIGWPWAAGTFSWVEPTSYAMLALKGLRGRIEDRRLEGRLDEADRLLADRSCEGGGWNYGNTRVFGEDLWPYPDTTAVALLALADRRDMPEVDGGLDALPGMLERNDSVLALSLGTLALSAHGRDAAGPRARLAEKIDVWEGGEIRALSWAGLALVERDDVLELSG